MLTELNSGLSASLLTGKLICTESNKEYAQGTEIHIFLPLMEDSGSTIFKPIVGGWYLLYRKMSYQHIVTGIHWCHSCRIWKKLRAWGDNWKTNQSCRKFKYTYRAWGRCFKCRYQLPVRIWTTYKIWATIQNSDRHCESEAPFCCNYYHWTHSPCTVQLWAVCKVYVCCNCSAQVVNS